MFLGIYSLKKTLQIFFIKALPREAHEAGMVRMGIRTSYAVRGGVGLVRTAEG